MKKMLPMVDITLIRLSKNLFLSVFTYSLARVCTDF